MTLGVDSVFAGPGFADSVFARLELALGVQMMVASDDESVWSCSIRHLISWALEVV